MSRIAFPLGVSVGVLLIASCAFATDDAYAPDVAPDAVSTDTVPAPVPAPATTPDALTERPVYSVDTKHDTTPRPDSVPVIMPTPDAPATPTPTPTPDAPVFPTYSVGPCATEDATDCYWDAARMGNGVGTSFVNIGGVYYYAAPAN